MGLPGDESGETAINATEKALNLFKSKLNIDLDQKDIDVAHRLGNYNEGRNRQVILKFVNRHEKSRVMAIKKQLKNSGTSIFEDLSRLNSEVLASARKKMPQEVDQTWSRNGKLFVKWKADSTVEQIKFCDYQQCLDMPWP